MMTNYFVPRLALWLKKNEADGIRTQKMIETFAMSIFQVKVRFISTFLNETAFQF